MLLSELIDELTFDARERLGVDLYEMPVNTAMAFFRSVLRIPGTHVHSKMLVELEKEKLEEEDLQEAVDGHTGVAAIGGTVTETEVVEMSDYWKDILGRGS